MFKLFYLFKMYDRILTKAVLLKEYNWVLFFGKENLLCYLYTILIVFVRDVFKFV